MSNSIQTIDKILSLIASVDADEWTAYHNALPWDNLDDASESRALYDLVFACRQYVDMLRSIK